MANDKDLLSRRVRRIFNDLVDLGLVKSDWNPFDFLRIDSGPIHYEICDNGCSGKVIPVPGPQDEGNAKAHLHITEHYRIGDIGKIIKYRYEICWGYYIDKKVEGDYVRELLLELKRGIRFDYHPETGGKDPKYHFHPNGCGDFRVETSEMEPKSVGLFAIYSFGDESNRDAVERNRTLSDSICEEFFRGTPPNKALQRNG